MGQTINISNRGADADKALSQFDSAWSQLRSEIKRGHREANATIVKRDDGSTTFSVTLLAPVEGAVAVNVEGTQHVLLFDGLRVSIEGDKPVDAGLVRSVQSAVAIATTPAAVVVAAGKAMTPTNEIGTGPSAVEVDGKQEAAPHTELIGQGEP